MDRVTQTKMALIEAMHQSLGVVTAACKKVGIGRSTFYNYVNDDPEFAAKVRDISEVALDFAESKLHQLISEGNVAATIFYLKTKGKSRGYIERVETVNAEVTYQRDEIKKLQSSMYLPKADGVEDADIVND